MKLHNRYALSAFAGLSLVGALAGCSSTASAGDAATVTSPTADPTATATAPGTSTTPAAQSSGAVVAATGTLKDGTYTETGRYQSPAGNDSIKVTLTLTNSVVTNLKVTPNATNPTAKQYQGDFVSGINALVVGKKIDSLKISQVSGSSLTSTGFNAAIAQIKSDATA